MSQLLAFIAKYKKELRVLPLLAVICGFTAAMAPDSFLKPSNIENVIRWTALFGIISIGVSFVIMTGGIDLSIGSVIGLVGCLLGIFLQTTYSLHDPLTVKQVDAANRILRVEEDSGRYRPGDRISFLEKLYEIESVAEGQLVVAEPVETGDQTGTLIRSSAVIELSDRDENVIRRGMKQNHSRKLTVGSQAEGIRSGDKVQLIYRVGIPKEFVVHDVDRSGENAQVTILTRLGQTVRKPIAAVFYTRSQRMPTMIAIGAVLAISLLIGLIHGLLITRIRLQPFIVTLCGLLIYRGIARYITADQEQGFGSEYFGLKGLANGDCLYLLTGQEQVRDMPMPFLYLAVLAIVAAIFLNRTIYGRYILALGRNEEAALYSGIHTERMVIVTYVICSLCAGLAGILFALDLNSVQPSGHGEFYELYAIAAAVLGGCSLRGGEGSIFGVVIAAAVMRVLNNAINLIPGIDPTLEFAIIGFVILSGVVADELVRRYAARRASARAKEAG